MTFISEERYADIIRVFPVLCVDIILKNRDGEYLLLKRKNDPKKGSWWPVGGRVLKGETLEEAAIRKAKEETGLSVRKPQPVGYFELFSERGPFDTPPGYHTVSIVFSASVDDQEKVTLDGQSAGWKYAGELPADFQVIPFHSSGVTSSPGRVKGVPDRRRET
jgi:colanic acid biosynthesis protein WcaH